MREEIGVEFYPIGSSATGSSQRKKPPIGRFFTVLIQFMDSDSS